MSKKTKSVKTQKKRTNVTEETIGEELTQSQKVFCREWVKDYNGCRAYKVAYPTVSDATATTNASRLLTNANIRKQTKYLIDNIGETIGISKEMVLNEHRKLAFTDMAGIHNTWITRKEFSELTADQRACIASIETQIKRAVIGKGTEDEEEVEVEFIRIKTWDKHKSMDAISRMIGYEAAQMLMTQNVHMEIEPTPEEAARIRESFKDSI